jgi:dipeptidyl-peptidase-4
MRKVLFALTLLLQFSFAQSQSALTNEIIWASQELSAEGIDAFNSMNDGLHYTQLDDVNGSMVITQYSFETGQKVGTIASDEDVFGKGSKKHIEGYEFSQDETMLLVYTNSTPIYRYSFAANYYVHDLKTHTTAPIAALEKGPQMLAGFSPDNQWIAFVRDNNLFAYHTKDKTELQITTDGIKNKIINGATDWVYEEEFAIVKGYQWSPIGNRIAWLRFDESEVPEYGMDMYGSLYPERTTFKYPKAGEKNSIVDCYVYDLALRQQHRVDVGSEKEKYLPRFSWTSNNDRLCVMKMNRHQNLLELKLADMSTPQPFELKTTTILIDSATTYVDVNDALNFLPDGSGFIWMSEKNNFNQLFLMDMTGKELAVLTDAKTDVIDFYGFNPITKTCYYTLSTSSGTEKQVYASTIGKKTKVECRALSQFKGNNNASFSKSYSYMVLTSSNASTPPVTRLFNISGKQPTEIRTLVSNEKLIKRLEPLHLTGKQFSKFPNSNGDSLNIWISYPPNFDAQKKYPVLVVIYGGPGHNTVVNQWEGKNYLWHQMMTQKGYIVASVDPRGTQFRGRKFKHATYMNLGKLETQDFIDFARWMKKQKGVDADRIGIQGWSYGGYMTSLCMTKGADDYKTGVAVAPVTNWKYYDSIYTERFMRTPQENNSGYEDNSPINFTQKLKGHYLLIHGSADDNVHFQNTMDMVSALVKNNKQFDLMVYPNKNHGIYGGNTRLHLFTKITDYFLENL